MNRFMIAIVSLFVCAGCGVELVGHTAQPQPDADIRWLDVQQQDATPVADAPMVPDAPPTTDSGSVEALSNVVVNLAWGGTPLTNADAPVIVQAVSHALFVPSVGMEFRAPTDSDIVLTQVTLAGRADVTRSGTLSTAAFSNVVVECALFDGDAQVGRSAAPDSRGRIVVREMTVPISRGTSRILTARCMLDSIVTSPDGSDRYAVGLAIDDLPFEARDDHGRLRLPQFGRLLSNQMDATITNPMIIVVVHQRGTLAITPELWTPIAQMLTANPSTWYLMASYRACAGYETMTIDRVNVQTRWESASYAAVAVAVDGRTVAMTHLPGGSEQSTDVDLAAIPIIIPRDTCRTFALWGQLAAVVSSTALGGTTHGVLRSGAMVALGLNGGLTTGEWDTTYADAFNVRATGSMSGERVRASHRGSDIGPSFIVRRTLLTVVRVLNRDNTLETGYHHLFRFIMNADVNSGAALKRMSFSIRIDRGARSSLTLSHLRLLRGDREVNRDEYRFYDETGRDLRDAMSPSTNDVFATVTFTNEELITWRSQEYTLDAYVSDAIIGDRVTTSFVRSARYETGAELFPTVRTGYLTEDGLGFSRDGHPDNPGPHLDLGDVAGPGTSMPSEATFIWSDLSEVPHSSLPGWSFEPARRGGSRDWTDDRYLQDMSFVHTLSR